MTKPYTRRSSSEWQQIIDDQAESGLSAPQYCKRHQVSYASFSKWRQYFSGGKTSPEASHSNFINGVFQGSCRLKFYFMPPALLLFSPDLNSLRQSLTNLLIDLTNDLDFVVSPHH
ncbi:IS66 family insertion sequence element accessory protein TnpA [Marinomonas sp. IMCC 4694]|uniref:IS66 family insertion sequence element accessory protein TnpA n=1 Tax=Marinomonas sp. IMCC 4694 TaxID=2605432 RepID=UPI0011E84AA1|nr:transposase [Marinomonas sp. IMCC 4694]